MGVGPRRLPGGGCSHTLPATPRCPADLVAACTALKDHVYACHPAATDSDYASCGFARCPVASCACLHCVAELPGGGAKPQWRSDLSTHVSRRDGQVNGGEAIPAGHHNHVASLGGNTTATKRAINVMSARAVEHSIGAAIINNGAKGGYVFRAAKDRLAGIQQSDPAYKATLPV